MENHWKALIGLGVIGGAILAVNALSAKLVKVPELFKETVEWKNLAGRIINDKVVYDIPKSPDGGRTSGSRIYVPENAQSIAINKDPLVYDYVFEYNLDGTVNNYCKYFDGMWWGSLNSFKPDKVYAIHAQQRIRLEIPLVV